jgi:hypothetical protein
MNIENQILALGEKYNLTPVLDGIVDEGQFSNTTPKILWILKEMNYPDGDEGFLDLRAVLAAFAGKKEIPAAWARTFHKLTYTTYGILDGFRLYNETPNRYEHPEMIEVLAKIAYINVNKLSGAGPVTNAAALAARFEENKELLFEQIRHINPDIVIGGATMPLIWKAMKLQADPEQRVGHAWGLKHDGRVWINAYHPAHRFSEKDYMDDIVSITKKLFNQT